MSFMECLRLALDSIKANKLRSFLTMLGIIIGISAVITITTIGNSLQQTLSSTMSSLGGTNMVFAYVSQDYSNIEDWDTFEYAEPSENEYISYDDLVNYQEKFEREIEAIVATHDMGGAVYQGANYNSSVSIMGSTEGWVSTNKLNLIAGRDISDADNRECKATAVVSDLFVKYALDGENPLGKEIELATNDGAVLRVYVVGVYKYDKSKLNPMGKNTAEKDITTQVIIPLTYSYDASGYSDGMLGFQVYTKDGVNPTDFAKRSQNYFAKTKYLESENFLLYFEDMASSLKQINTILNVVTIAISVIAAISLIVGGVGVMNIMLVSVMERTREIGIRKALGAKNRSIQLQFLTESIVICLIGGIIGIVLGICMGFVIGQIAVMVMNSMSSDVSNLVVITVRPSPIAILVSVFFSMLTGMVFGSYPASRAAKMSPIDALRYE